MLAWRLSNTMEADFCVEALEDALSRFGCPEIFNTDQGSQFTGYDFTGVLKREGIKISMDGKGRFMDNIFIERRSLKYEEVFIKPRWPRPGPGRHWRLPGVLQRRASAPVVRLPDAPPGVRVWTCGRSAQGPTGCASPMSPAEAGNMGKCSPSPTCPQAPQQQPEMYMHDRKKVLQSFATSPVVRVDA